MIYIKTAAEIEAIRLGGRLLAGFLKKLKEAVKPGVDTADLEAMLIQMVEEAGGRPAFKDYPMGGEIYFPSAICASINDEVVHGAAIPGRILKEGDIIDLDIGMEWPVKPELRAEHGLPTNPHSLGGGYYTDTCTTVAVGEISKEARQLMKVTKECLDAAIKKVRPGATLNDIGDTVQTIAEGAGYGVVRDLVGHGVGYYSHELPDIYHYRINPRSSANLELKAGMVICIEPMINAGTHKVTVADNGFTILSADKSLSAHYEHTIAVTDDGYSILTLE
ncbi:type I methionyl aminopeptidase [Candidatus Falkowbacteria bacterium HGW-Falkowbacteria-2]|uniref:Methionine aminopeptidase n=1 Tax=Candidatus Falkowbacteria bacterium HGW-Falkowbacteria-2 TaxID=2013769 RepID=A0A2N2E314_9BACT|nr:MAG: type I methionyl aminopeptidase [Candidatus Falkowbacteria bacterium HGW-Falkowbacteria-2]